MKKITILIYLVLGIIFQITQAFIENKVFANTSLFTSTNNTSYKQTDFTYAAEKSLEAVVHIKSKIMEDEYYRYYHPLWARLL